MPYALRGLCIAVAALGLAAPAQTGRAWADQASAQACAKTLQPEAVTIYRDSAPEVTPGTDLRSLLKIRVKALVMAGRVQRATAHASAVSAYGCLKRLK
jgi:hypothetical protein